MPTRGSSSRPISSITGAAPNQQIIPAVNGASTTCRKFVLVGSDYVWPHSVNAIVSDQLQSVGWKKVGEEIHLLR